MVPVPAASPEALAYHAVSNWFWALDQACALAVPAAFLAFGWGARLHRWAVRVSGGRQRVAVAVVAALFFLSDRLARSVIAFLWDRAHAHAAGRDGPALAPWIAAQVPQLAAWVAGLTLLVTLGYWLLAASPRWWWLWASAAGSALVLAALLLEPFTQAHGPLDRAPLAELIATTAARASVPRDAIGIERCEPASSCPPGRVIGLGPTRLLLLNDAWMASHPASWTRSVVAHEAKHFANDDNVTGFVLLSGLLVAALALVYVAGSAILRRWSRPLGVEDLSHGSSLPLLVLLLGAFHLVALPPVNAIRQRVELEGDRFALELTRDNEGQAEMLADGAREPGRVPEWSAFFRLFRATHPSLTERIRLANTYQPWREGNPLAYDRYLGGR